MSHTGTPTADEAFGPDVPTADQAFGSAEPDMSGSFADYAMTQNPFAHVLKSFGQGFQENWGAEPTGLSPDTEKELSKAGVFNDYSSGRYNIIKSFNEFAIRNAAIGLKLPGALLAGTSAALTTASHEEKKLAPYTGGVIGGVLGVPGQLSGIAAEGGGLEFVNPAEAHLSKARSEAAIGESESNFFGTTSPTEAQARARAEAVGAVQVQGIQPDIHNVARQIAPETFAHYDALVDRQDFLEKSLRALEDDRVNDDNVKAAQARIDSILDRVNGNEEELSEAGQEELSRSRDIHSDVLHEVTPEVKSLRDELSKINEHLVNLSPDVRYAYKEASRALDPSQNATSGATEPVQGIPEGEATPVAPQNQGTPGPSQGLSGQSSLTGEIASDVSQRLQKAGRPLEEADAVGQLIEAHYNARAERMGGRLGTGKDVFDQDFPDISTDGKIAKGRTLSKVLNQAGLRVARKLPDGTVKIGEHGQLHFELYEPMEYAKFSPVGDGFATSEGKFLSRAEAVDWVKQNNPEVYNRLNKDSLEDLGGLESVRYDIARGFKQDQRGSITLREGRNLIRLFKDADASTFLHETGHQWLEEMTKDAQHPDASPELKADLKTVRDFLKNKGDPWARGEHEKFARTFERYLREGNAPSRGLARVFEKFKAWLEKIYQKVGQLKAPINDDIRRVFDRLIVQPTRRDVIAPERVSPRKAPTVETPTQEAPKNAAPVVPSQSQQATPVAPTEGTPAGGTASEVTPGGSTEGTSTEGTPTEGPVVKAEKPSDEPSTETPLEVEPAGNIRVENLTSEADLQTYIRDFYDQNKADLDRRQGKISDSDLLDLAEAAGLKASDINVQKLQEMSVSDGIPYSARVLGLRQAFIDSAKNTWDISRKEPPDPLAFQQAKERHLWLQQVLTQVTGEAGRTLRVFKNLEGGKGSMGDAAALSEFFQNTVGQPVEKVLDQMKLASSLKDISQVSGFIRDSEKASAGEMLLEFFRNNLISGPITHMTYAAGNKIFALYKAFPERLATAAVGAIHEAVVGHPIERAYAGEAGEGVYAMLFGQRDGLKAAWDSFKAGQTLPLPGEDLASTPFTRSKAIPGLLGSAVRLPGERMVAPIHSFDRTVGYLTNRAQLIFRKAKSEGLEGEALNQRIAELEKDTPSDLVKAAVEEATSQSLMGRPGEPTRRFLSFVRTEFDLPVLGRTQPGSFVAPFISVVSNINRLAFLERGPLGLLSKTFWENATGKNGTLAQDSSIAKMGLGIAVAGTAAGLLLQGKTTPAASSNYHEATIDEMVQGIPHGIRIGDMSYQFNRLGIVGTMLAMATDVAYAGKAGLESHDYEKGVSLLLHSLSATFTQEGMMSGISDLLNAVDDPDRYGKSYVNNLLGSFIPYSVGMAQVAHLADPYQRATNGWLETIQNKIPGLTEDLQPRVDIFGQKIPNKEYYGVYAEQVSNDPVIKAFKDNGYFPAPVEKKINGVSLSDDEYFQYAQKAGVLSKMLLNRLVGMPGFSQLSHQTRHDMLRDQLTSGRSAARAWMLMNYPDIAQKSVKMKSDLVGRNQE